MKQKRIAECKYNSLAPYSGKEANGKIEYRDSFLVSVLFCSLDKFLLKIVQVNNGITLIYHQFTEMPTVHR